MRFLISTKQTTLEVSRSPECSLTADRELKVYGTSLNEM